MITLPFQRYLTLLLIGLLILLALHFLSIANYSLTSPTILTSHPSHHTIHPPPPEYPTSYPADPDARCEANHGLPYLQHIAQNHIPYCDLKESRGGFECFQTIHEDLICVASGVQYTSSPTPTISTAPEVLTDPPVDEVEPSSEPHRPFSMHCKMRNLTQEVLDDPAKGQEGGELYGFRDREKMKEYMYDTGIPVQFQSWKDGDGKTCNSAMNDGTFTLLTRREQTGNIWHRLLEMWQVKLSLDALSMSGFIKGFEREKVQVVFQDDKKGPWDELLWPMVTGKKPLYMNQLEDACLGTVILPLVGATSPFWWGVWENLPCRESFVFDPFIKSALKHMGLDTPPRLTEDTTVTIVNRTGTSNTRQLWNVDAHAEALRHSFPGVTVQVSDFAAIELREQIKIIRDTDVLIGAMGAGLTHLFFLNEESTIAEVMAPDANYGGFRNLAKIRKMPYFIIHGVPEEEFKTTEEWKAVGGVGLEAVPKLEVAESLVPTQTSTVDEVPTEMSEAIVDPKEAAKNEEVHERTSRRRKTQSLSERHWQNDEYLYLSEKQFIALAAAAINAQGNRGTRIKDVYPH